jgi:hypothetical protein
VAEPDQEHRIDEQYGGRAGGRSSARSLSRTEAELLDRLADRFGDEVEGAELTVAGGYTVRIVCTSEVEQWLAGLAARARGGAIL